MQISINLFDAEVNIRILVLYKKNVQIYIQMYRVSGYGWTSFQRVVAGVILNSCFLYQNAGYGLIFDLLIKNTN